MGKDRSVFTCQECGFQSPKWLGRCPGCNQWGTLVEEAVSAEVSPTPHRYRFAGLESRPQSITEISPDASPRSLTTLEEFDRALGGGVVQGSLVLIGGDPGVGKSTLLLQVADRLCQGGGKILYISGEESPAQIKLRARRLGIEREGLYLLSETNFELIRDNIIRLNPQAAVIDSIQTVYTEDLSSAPGSVSQVRECAGRLMQLAKSTDITIFLIGHVTKEGAIAGPRVLEHIVDTVLYLEGDRSHLFRILRAVKNRFGSTNEIGIFEMGNSGLVAVSNPSEIFLEGRPEHSSGSIVVPSLEGTRPILVEIQALVSKSPLTVPRRVVTGVDYTKATILAAVLDKKAGLPLSQYDIFVNVAGGVKIAEPAADLGIVLAIASSFRDVAIDDKTVAMGEVGLGGEVRAINNVEKRLSEAAKLGFTQAIIPFHNRKNLRPSDSISLIPCKTVGEVLRVVFG
ncbi:MAG: DNA repair protein RadA [bacterium]